MALQAAGAVEPASTSVPWVYFSSLTVLAAGAVFYLYLARVLSYSDLGAVVILSAIAALVSVGFSLGVGPAFQHFLSFHLGRSDPTILKTLVRSAFFFSFVLSAGSLAATLALSTALSDFFFHTRAYSGAIVVLAVFAGISTGNSTLQSVLLGLQKFAVFSRVLIVGSVATYGLAIGFFWIRPGVDSIVVGWTMGAALACALYLVSILRSRRVWSGSARGESAWSGTRLHRRILAYSLPLFVWSVLSTGAIYVDRLVLASVANLASVGVYNYALLIASGSLFVVGPFSTILIPKISKAFGERNDVEIRALTRGATSLIVLMYVPIGLGMAALGPLLLKYLAGPGFVAASLPMIVLLVVSAAFVPYSILASIAAGTRRTLGFAKAAALALAANVALSVVLVPRFGMMGAAVGNSSMTWVPFVVFYFELHPSGLVRFDFRALSRIWLATVAAVAAFGLPLWGLGYDPVFVPFFVFCGVACLAVLLRLLEAITPETAALLLQVLPRRFRSARCAIYWLTPLSRAEDTQTMDGIRLLHQR